MTATLFPITADDVVTTSDDWYTPRWIFDAAGLVFDVDVAAPIDPAWRTCPAQRYLTPADDGLTCEWDGLVWMNPPYSRVRPWAERFAAHGNGLALVPGVRSFWVNVLLDTCDAICLLGDVRFALPDGRSSTLRSVSILAAAGPQATSALYRVANADVLHGQGMAWTRVRPAETL